MPYSPGELGKLASQSARELALLGWQKKFHHHRKYSSLKNNIHTLPHEAAPYLSRLAHLGVHLGGHV
jgi:hypothetical protein